MENLSGPPHVSISQTPCLEGKAVGSGKVSRESWSCRNTHSVSSVFDPLEKWLPSHSSSSDLPRRSSEQPSALPVSSTAHVQLFAYARSYPSIGAVKGLLNLLLICSIFFFSYIRCLTCQLFFFSFYLSSLWFKELFSKCLSGNAYPWLTFFFSSTAVWVASLEWRRFPIVWFYSAVVCKSVFSFEVTPICPFGISFFNLKQ